MPAPLAIAGSNVIRIGGGMVLRRVSMGNALTGLGTGLKLMDLVEDDNGNVYRVEPETSGGRRSTRSMKIRVPKTKKKRKVSKYQKRFGVHLKKLKKAHPRTNISTLMKRAHRLTKRELK